MSVNYLFVLLPLLVGAVRGALARPPASYRLLIGMYAAIFVVAAAYQVSYLPYMSRRIISFFLFMTMFTYMFMKVDEDMVSAFKKAVIGISLWFSIDSLTSYIAAGGGLLGSSAKNVVGTQRIGFMYVVAFWLVAQEKYRGRFFATFKYPMLMVLVIGLLLTFSRSSVFALLGSGVIFALVKLGGWLNRPAAAPSLRQVASVVMILVVGYAVTRTVPLTLTYFNNTFLRIVLDRDLLTEHLTDPFYSEGYRVFMGRQVMDFVARNPFTGSGYLGVWVLSDNLTGSAHNQLLDVLFRTGLPGFAAYLFLLVRLLRYLYAGERPLFFGIAGVLLYGLYHETFKESQGAFVLAFLLGLVAQRRVSLRVVATRRRAHDGAIADDPRGLAGPQPATV